MPDVPIKKSKNRSLRSKQKDCEDEEEVDLSLLEEVREWQKARKRPIGLDLERLNSAAIDSKEKKSNDIIKQKMEGGFVDAKTLKREMESEDIHQLKCFAVETNKTFEDDSLKNYVDERMEQIKGANKKDYMSGNRFKNPEDALFELPDHLKEFSEKKKTEETLSAQMLSGIPEVDLGMDAKIKNILATEDAKMKFLKERHSQKNRGVSEFVPTNIAVDFVQHKRFYIEEKLQPRSKPQPTTKATPVVRVGDADESNAAKAMPSYRMPSNREKATDDIHYEKFKRHMR